MFQTVLVGSPLLHGLAVSADAPEALPALGPVHGRAFLGLADVRALLVAAPEVGARVVELQTDIIFTLSCLKRSATSAQSTVINY